MKAEIIQFEWTRHPDGCVVEEGGVVRANGDGDVYTPPSDLYLTFTKVEPTRDGIITFASRYGMLSDKPDSIQEWKRATGEMNVALALLSIVEQADEPRGLPWQEGAWPIEMAEEWTAYQKFAFQKSFALFEEPKERVLYQIKHQRSHARDYVKRLMARNLLLAPLQPVSAPDNPFTLQSRIVPRTLRAFMWASLLISVEGHRYVQCAMCGSWMLVSREGVHALKRTCSGRCRIKAHRLRHKALALRKKRKTTDAIAKQLGVTRAQVEDWLKVPVSETGKVVKRSRRV
jgi:hypothetical protein